MPEFVSGIFDHAYDAIPSSAGFIVDGGELGRGDSPILAGIPLTSKPMRVLNNISYINLFSETNKQPLCVAYKITNDQKTAEPSGNTPISDPRVPSLKIDQLSLSQWQPTAIAPPTSLANTYGDDGAQEAMLLTNFVPMKEAFAQSLWKEAVQEVAVNYPKRFDEIWVYAGPAYSKQASKLSSGVPLPDSVYLIAFDLTISGGLRTIAFLIPTDAPPETMLDECLTSIADIEAQTGMQFMPQLGFDSKDVLLHWVSPNLW
ncbi:MAG: DNA/RNA non-specific endonuclease [Opitutaceae bacterium]